MQYNVLEYLENTACRLPEKEAFFCQDGGWSFERLMDVSKRVGTALAIRLHGVQHQPIVVFQERSPESIAAFLGVAYSGNCYVPLDAGMPPERLKAILDLLRPAAAIIMGEAPAQPFGCPVISFAQAVLYEADEALLKAIRLASTDQDPLYIIFTSGSTGTPKGVITCHRSVIDYIDAFAEIAHITQDDVLGSQAPLDYVAAIRDIYLPLKQGASCYLLPKSLFSMPARLFDTLDERRVTTLCWVASAFVIPAKMNAFAYKVPRYVNKVIFTGAVMPSKYLRRWQQALPDALYINHYGPTEITASCTYAVMDHLVGENETLPIGVPYRNTGILLLDEGGREITAPGEIGELCVRGCSLALGYYGAPEATAKAFVQNPLNAAWPERIYRTGDYASRDEQGVLWFHGRKDSQIKLMGHRVELFEIEEAARAVEGVEDACCLFQAEKEWLWLFVQSATAESAGMFEQLKRRLPGFMIPRRLVIRPALPALANGKVDRRSLMAEMEAQSHGAG